MRTTVSSNIRPWHPTSHGDIGQFPAIGRTQADFKLVWPAYAVYDGIEGYWNGYQFVSRGNAMPYDENEAHEIREAILKEMRETSFGGDAMEDVITVERVTW
jgi:hypothetical protein